MQSNCSIRRIGSVVIFDLFGRITLGDGDKLLQDALTNELAKGSKHILLNLAGVRYVDAAGIGQFVDAYIRARACGAVVKLLKPSNIAYVILTLTKLATVFEIHQDQNEALVSFGSRCPGCSYRDVA